jgi:hypothetical protein
MNEYEITDLLNGAMSNAKAQQGPFLTILSAYLVMAYAAGRKLTTYQSSFVSLVLWSFRLRRLQAIMA